MNTTNHVAHGQSMNEQAYKLALLGLDDVEIARVIGISESTLTTWKGRHPELLASLKGDRSLADAELAASLHKRATGYVVIKARSVTNSELPDGSDHNVFVESLEAEFSNAEPLI